MSKLNKASLTYLHILFVIWSLLDYFSVLSKTDVPDDPTELFSEIIESDGLTHIQFAVPKIPNHHRDHTVLQLVDIYNDYLRIVLLPSQTYLKPYKNGSTYLDIIEPLYIDTVYEDSAYLFIDVLLVDSPLAFKHVRNFENIRF